jgi:acetyltransferase-like isoleucine patch superfamily enzyme
MPVSERLPAWHHLPDNPWNPHAWIVGEPEIGDNCWIGAFCVIDGSGGLKIGEGCDISAGAQIYSHSTVDRVLAEGQAEITSVKTVIGSFVHVGAGAVVLMGSTIGHHSIVGAGSVVLEGSTAPPYSLLVGVPARVIPEGSRRRIASTADGHL